MGLQSSCQLWLLVIWCFSTILQPFIHLGFCSGRIKACMFFWYFYHITVWGLTSSSSSISSKTIIVSDFMVGYISFRYIFVNIFFIFWTPALCLEVNSVFFLTKPALQNSGKACILTDANRILRDLILQVESLGKENVALVTESCYVSCLKPIHAHLLKKSYFCQ